VEEAIMRQAIATLVFVSVVCAVTPAVQAGGSVEASARALEHSMQALGYSIEAGLKLAFGAAAVPLTIVGGIGEASREAGNEFWEFANAPPSGPLPVSDEIVTAGPPPDAKQEQQGQAAKGQGQLRIEELPRDPSPDRQLNSRERAQ
jgi:hypothetical protein